MRVELSTSGCSVELSSNPRSINKDFCQELDTPIMYVLWLRNCARDEQGFNGLNVP